MRLPLRLFRLLSYPKGISLSGGGRGFLPISARKSKAAGATPGPRGGDVGAVLKTRPAAQTCDVTNSFVSDSFEECSQGSKVRYVGYGFYGPQCAQTSWGSNCGACFGNRSSFGGERQAIRTHHTSAAVQTPVYQEMLHRIHNQPSQLCRPARIPSTNHSKKKLMLSQVCPRPDTFLVRTPGQRGTPY